MKRREFLAVTASTVGTLLPIVARASDRPCPPATFGVAGGGQVSSACVPGRAPTWFLDMPDNTWARIAGGASALEEFQRGARLHDVRASLPRPVGSGFVSPSGAQSDICKNYTGGCVDQDRGELILAANGGHAGYFGNEVYALAVRSERPGWIRLTNPTPGLERDNGALLVRDAIGNQAANVTASNLDYKPGRAGPDGRPYGNPMNVHGWHKCCFGEGRVWYAGMTAVAGVSGHSTATWSFDRGEAESLQLANGGQPIEHMQAPWTYHGLAFETMPGSVYAFDIEGGPAVFDRVGRRVWSFAGLSILEAPNDIVFWSVDVGSGKVTKYRKVNRDTAPGLGGQKAQGDPQFGAQWAAFAHDVGTTGILIVAQRLSRNIWVFDPSNPAQGLVRKLPLFTPGSEFRSNFESIGDGDPNCNTKGTGAVYHSASRSILTWNDWSGLSGGGNGATFRKLRIPDDPINGEYVWSLVQPSPKNTVVPVNEVQVSQGPHSRFNIIEDMGNGQSALICQLDTTGPAFVYKLPIAGV